MELDPKSASVLGFVCIAIGTADTTLVGQNFAAGRMNRVRKVIYASLGICCCFVTAMSLVLVLYPNEIFGLFDRNTEVLTVARSYVVIAILNFYGSALRSPVSSFINGIGFSSMSMIIGVVDGLIGRVLLALLLV